VWWITSQTSLATSLATSQHHRHVVDDVSSVSCLSLPEPVRTRQVGSGGLLYAPRRRLALTSSTKGLRIHSGQQCFNPVMLHPNNASPSTVYPSLQ